MARQRRLGPLPAVRSVVREGVRAGEPRSRILAEVRTLFPSVAPQTTGRIISEETRRQRDVDRMFLGDKRTSFDSAEHLGCPAGSGRLRMHVTISFVDPRDGVSKTFNTTAETAGRGRLADILNDALQQVTDAARAAGYDPGRITSAQTRGSFSYRINYVDCI